MNRMRIPERVSKNEVLVSTCLHGEGSNERLSELDTV
jgi:hypothetical protein